MTNGGTTYNSQTTFSCDPGYTGSGSATRTCQSSGTWSGSAYICSIKSCSALSAPANGAMSGSSVTYNSVVTFTCSSGYTGSGSASRTCLATKTWSGTAFTCSRISCGDPGAVADSTRTAPGFLYGDTIAVTCSTGYQITAGNAQRTCLASGSWDRAQPVCTIIPCPALTAPANGAMTSGGTTYNSQTTFTCDPGYSGTGSATRTCQASGSWSGTAYTCARISCGDPGAVTGGNRTFPGFLFTDTITVTCNTGYNLTSGNAQRTCLPGGTWSNAQPVCSKKGCPPLSANPNVAQTGSSFVYQDVVSWNCDPGYQVDSGDSVVVCSASQTWNGTALTCKKKTCPTLAPSANATQQGNGSAFLDVVSWTCDTGYERNTGSPVVQCQASRQWNGTKLTCQRVTCPGPSVSSPPSVSVTNNLYQGAATYSCNTAGQMIVSGSQRRLCQANRTWSGTAPACGPAKCLVYPPPNAHVTASTYGILPLPTTQVFSYQETIDWACDRGYAQTGGNQHRECGSGNFTKLPIVCDDFDECLSTPCRNGGNCLNTIGEYSCRCVNGYTGKLCGITPSLSSSLQSIISGQTGGAGLTGTVGGQTINQIVGTGGTITAGVLTSLTGGLAGSYGVRVSASTFAILATLLLSAVLRRH